jgi:hypothetical protein
VTKDIIRLLRTRRAGKASVTACLLLSLSTPGAQRGDSIRLDDNSDWWSTLRDAGSDTELESEQREFANSNFQIMGVGLGDKMFGNAVEKLGRAKAIKRGDAASGRTQVCYASSSRDEKTRLVFEEGEVRFAFYLFLDGPTWHGSEYCVTSNRISSNPSTGSGLRLGQTRDEVIAILGKPTRQTEDEIVYAFSVRKTTSSKDLAETRRQHPEMTEKELEGNYGFYYLRADIRAKFTGTKLTYLAVSKAETT